MIVLQDRFWEQEIDEQYPKNVTYKLYLHIYFLIIYAFYNQIHPHLFERVAKYLLAALQQQKNLAINDLDLWKKAQGFIWLQLHVREYT